MNAETLNKVQQWRAKEADGTMTKDDYKQAIIFLRESRTASQVANAASGKSPRKAKAPAKSADEMLGELGL